MQHELYQNYHKIYIKYFSKVMDTFQLMSNESMSLFVFCNIVSSSGSVQYSEVKAFLKKIPDVIMKYMSITTDANKTITLSENHLIYAKKFTTEQFHPM